FGSAETYDPVQGAWSPAPPLLAPRWSARGTLLEDGTALVSGGFANASGTMYLSECEIYTPKPPSWKQTGDLNDPRAGHTATLVRGAGVLVAGGGAVGGELSSVELYAGGAWTRKHDMIEMRRNHFALLMPDQAHVLVGGGQGLDVRAEIFDVSQNAWAEQD